MSVHEALHRTVTRRAAARETHAQKVAHIAAEIEARAEANSVPADPIHTSDTEQGADDGNTP